MYKIKKELPKEFKIKVNPDQSEALQKHLLCIGKSWQGKEIIQYLDKPYLYINTCEAMGFGTDTKVFKNYCLPRIKFKDYLTLPEKWCIDITEDNYQELRTWVHANSQNYEAYAHTWFNDKSLIVGKILFSHSNHTWDKGLKDTFYEYITTEQFRKHFQKLETKELKKHNRELQEQIAELKEKLKTINKLTNH